MAPTSTSKNKNNNKSEYVSRTPAVEQACQVLICLARNGGVGLSLTEISAQVGIHKSKGLAIMTALERFGFVSRDPLTKSYTLGMGVLPLSRTVLNNLDYREQAEDLMAVLARETKSTAFLAMRDSDQVYLVAKSEGTDIGFTIGIGQRYPLTNGAHGKAIAAFMPLEEREELLIGEKLYFYGKKKITKKMMADLRREIETAGRCGFATDLGLIQPGLNVVAAPVFGHSNEIIGALIIMGAFSLESVEDFGRRVVKTSGLVSRRFGADLKSVNPDWFSIYSKIRSAA